MDHLIKEGFVPLIGFSKVVGKQSIASWTFSGGDKPKSKHLTSCSLLSARLNLSQLYPLSIKVILKLNYSTQNELWFMLIAITLQEIK